MRYGLFMMPLHPPGKDATQAYDEDLELLVRADELGYGEAWVGEHFTTRWENIVAPDLFIAKALPLTQRIVLGTGVALLPFHHPLLLAQRIAFLDHPAHGRFYFGIGAGGVPTDMELFGIDAKAGEHRARTREAIDIILKAWTEERPFTYSGRYWRVKLPEPRPDIGLGYHMKPYQKPHPPIAVAGSTRDSETLRLAGEHGWIPMSINFLPVPVLQSHWRAIEAGAAQGGRVPSRREWRIAREIYVAETTQRARQEALEGPMIGAFQRYFRTLLQWRGGLDVFKIDPSMPDAAVTPEYLLEHIYIVGDPEECARRLRALHDAVGGFGTVLLICHDWQPRERWLQSVELLAKEVMPRLQDG
jgi:alkanesulfonate monooxygenase SsuD/methylene tetrahydromethanopterin reductase-like flavin-dependent oxidoreductase (luciferase family)